MDLTSFVVSRRNEALLVGDYGTYRSQLGRRLLTLRRRLGRTTSKGKKYATKAPVTAEEIASNPEYAYLLILTSERAWAHAMHMKSLHASDSSEKAIAGSTRRHVISRLRKAERQAARLAELLRGNGGAASKKTGIEALAYQHMLLGSLEFESQKWDACLRSFSAVRATYIALSRTGSTNQAEVFRELLTSTVDPSIRYAAYKLGQPRTISIPTLASRFADRDLDLVQEALDIDGTALDTGPVDTKPSKDVDTKDAPKTISWRSRKVNIEDANIAQSLALANIGERNLQEILSDSSKTTLEKAAAYDEVLNPSQDAVDATKTAIDELTADGIPQGDPRMQSLYVTRTAVNYALVGWRIGRNRLLCGRADGAHLDTEEITIQSKKAGGASITKKEGPRRKLARLRERVVLYDSTLQSLESIESLPGVAADASLLGELESKRAYFAALRCLTLAYARALLAEPANALALFARARAHAQTASASRAAPTDSPANMEVTEEQVGSLRKILEGLVARHRALVDIERIASERARARSTGLTAGGGAAPLIERLDDYPAGGADLTNLVNYPPKVRPVPVKPIFLDLAWNYIDYPGRQQAAAGKKAEEPRALVDRTRGKEDEEGEKPAARKGWFSSWGR